MLGEIISALISFIGIGLIVEAKKSIDDLDLESSPRAFYDLQNSDSDTVVPLQALVLISDLVILGFGA